MNPIAVAEIIIVSLYLMMPTTPFANPFYDEFDWKFLNYTPVVTVGALIILTIWWNVSARNWFTGPKHTIDQAVARRVRVTDDVEGDSSTRSPSWQVRDQSRTCRAG